MEHRPTLSAFGRTTGAALDYPQLVAGLAMQQAGTATAITAAWLAANPSEAPLDPLAALARVARGRPGWAAAAQALGSSFHPRIATVLLSHDP
ncbi:hypothetical protein ABC347_11615 [Sphingomonas sp. 1P06PA]|uniref:hypothetical protein n=1 Tax=Sphingomonas sp. 1P06PA TaxID=554121 RepID=UPI0039A77B5E